MSYIVRPAPFFCTPSGTECISVGVKWYHYPSFFPVLLCGAECDSTVELWNCRTRSKVEPRETLWMCWMIYTILICINRRKFRSQTSDNMDRWKAEVEQKNREEKSRREKIREEKESEERRCRCEKRQESPETLCFPMICGSRGSKSRLAKAAGAEPAGQMRDEKLHAVVARSTFPSQNVQNTSLPHRFGSWDV